MYYDSFLPFLNLGFMEKNISEVVDISTVYCPLSSTRGIDDLKNDAVVNKTKPIIFHVLPLNIKVFNMSDLMSYYFKTAYSGNSLLCDVTYIDYTSLAKRIEITGGKAFIKQNGAYMEEDSILTDVFVNTAANGVSLDLTNLANRGIILDIPMEEKLSINDLFNPDETSSTQNTPVKEAIDLKAIRAKAEASGAASNIRIYSKDYIYSWIEAYFQLPEGQERTAKGKDGVVREVVPLLMGPTGVFKSATVKELCKKFNYRMVDFRVAFTSRLDYSGLFERAQLQGEEYSYACPMEELVTCSDGFREYCKRALVLLNNTINSGEVITGVSSTGNNTVEDKQELTKEQTDAIFELIKKYEYYVKTPVLFFDEITRNKNKGVEGVLVTLLNQKRFDNMTLSQCKFIAATNINLGMDPDLDEAYDVEKDFDVAYSNRFLPLKVFPEDVKDRWFDWARIEQTKKDKTGSEIGTGKYNIHPIIVEYLQLNPLEVYNAQYVLNVLNQDGVEAAAASPFPNYRTWDMLSGYIYGIEKNNGKAFNTQVIQGLICDKAAEKFIPFLVKKGFKAELYDAKTDDVGKFLEHNLDMGIPALIMGPSSLGKTSRVNAYAKGNDGTNGKPYRPKAEVIHINLASMDTSDVMGPPVKKSVVGYVTKDIKTEGLDYLSKQLGDLVNEVRTTTNTGLVDKLTLRAPDLTKKERFVKALNDPSKNIILFFDECNRVTNPSLMSAMFEATSDYRLFGIDFRAEKDRVKVVAACNYGVNYGNAKKLDAALAARFSVYWKKDYDNKDAQSFKAFLKDNVDKDNISSILYDFINEMKDEDLVTFMKQVELRQIENAEPSSRMIFQLANDIKNMEKSRMFCGITLFNALTDKLVTIVSDVGEANNTRFQALQDLAKIIKQREAKWAPVRSGETAEFYGNTGTAKEFADAFLEYVDDMIKTANTKNATEMKKEINYAKSALDILVMLDSKVVDTRKNMFEAYTGPVFASQFAPYFNQRFGARGTKIKIEELDDASLIPEFIDQELTPLSGDIDKKISTALSIVDQFGDVFTNTLPPENYKELFTNIAASLSLKENVMKLITLMGTKEETFMSMAEKAGDDFILQVLKTDCGFPSVSQNDIDSIRAIMTGTGAPKKKAKLL